MESTPPPPLALLPAKLVSTGSTERHGGAASSSPPSSSLHAVRKPPSKPWKKPTVPPPKVYRIDPPGFRLLVQRLTGAQELPPARRLLRDAAPAQLDLVPRQVPPTQSTRQLPAAAVHVHGHGGLSSPSTTTLECARGFPQGEAPSGETPRTEADGAGHQAQEKTASTVPSPSLYSAFLTWCNLPLLSPGSMDCLEQSSVL